MAYLYVNKQDKERRILSAVEGDKLDKRLWNRFDWNCTSGNERKPEAAPAAPIPYEAREVAVTKCECGRYTHATPERGCKLPKYKTFLEVYGGNYVQGAN